MAASSSMTHVFSMVPKADIPRSSFNRSHGWKGTFDSGYLIPFYVDEALPGDTFNLNVTTLVRLATPIVPIMDNLYVDTFFFFVPNRLLWSHWKEFMGECTYANQGSNGIQTGTYLVPTTTSDATNGVAVGTLYDYMGIPTGTGAKGLTFNNLHGRAYALCYNEWFRDENLCSFAHFDVDDGPDTITNYVLKRRGKRHDYFTSALPWPQKGTGVSVPIASNPVIKAYAQPSVTSNAVLLRYTGSTTLANNEAAAASATGKLSDTLANHDWYIDPNTTLYADMSQSAATINDLRMAFQTQKLYERDARGGSRYTEIIRSHFGVVSPDARQQRPEYLGGSSRLISINPVVATSATDTAVATQSPQGTLAAYGVSANHGGGFTKSFTEHGVLLGLINVRADLNYQQGLNRMWSRQTRLDYYWPALSHTGEQAILNKEIYAQGANNTTQDAQVFGYQERYAEYRYFPSTITGQFRSTYATPLDMWHLAQKFTSLPSLNQAFIEENPPLSRILAVGTGANGAQLICDAYFKIKAARPMPTYSVPGMIDHF